MAVYWSKIRVSVSTCTKLPRIKYTPSEILKADPVAAASFEIVTANGLPAAIVLFPSNPDAIVTLQVKFSPSENTWVELLFTLDFI